MNSIRSQTQFATALLLIAGVSACATPPESVAPAPALKASAEPAPVEPTKILGGEWRITSISGAPVVGLTPLTIGLAKSGRAFGFGGCNSFSVNFKHNHDALFFGSVEITEKACIDDGLMAQEAAFTAALRSEVPTAMREDGTLVLTGADGVILMAIRPETPNLSGSDWKVTSISRTRFVAGHEPVLSFGAGGRLSGSGGCNSLFGDYSQDGVKLTITALGTTKMMCTDKDVMEQEMTFLNLLTGITELEFLNSVSTFNLVTESGDGFRAERAAPAVPSDPALLLGAEWIVEDINRTGIIDNSHLTLTFGADGRVSGSTNCNTFGGVYSADETTVTLAPLAMTRKACLAPAMAQQEQKYMAALNGEMSWTMTADGALELAGPAGQRLLLRR